ncbi:MAG: hypothetical protein ACE5HC_12330 [Candidatus Binatia bacterium]
MEKGVNLKVIRSRPGWDTVRNVSMVEIHEIKSAYGDKTAKPTGTYNY